MKGLKYLQALILLVSILITGCGLQSTFVRDDYKNLNVEKPKEDDIVQRVILIGDAGEPSGDKREPVLDAVEIQATFIPEKSVVVFLGDNIYPYGLDDPEHELRTLSEGRLNEQIKVAENSKSSAIFVPGNHDWDQGGDEGWHRIKLQEQYIDIMGNSKITMLPKHGCPGPVIKDYSDHLRLVVLDTQWWLHNNEKPNEENSECNPVTEDGVLTALEDALKTAGDKFVVIVAHHPMNTYGPHGGHFDWQEHIFPLLNFHPYLWIPLPVIGSLYPIARWLGISPQDMSSTEYKHMINSIESVLSKYDNWTFAAGHEHSVQVLEAFNDCYYLVSGFGTAIHTSNVSVGEETIFADVEQGFMQIDILKNKKARLSIFKVDEDEETWVEVFSLWLNEKK